MKSFQTEKILIKYFQLQISFSRVFLHRSSICITFKSSQQRIWINFNSTWTDCAHRWKSAQTFITSRVWNINAIQYIRCSKITQKSEQQFYNNSLQFSKWFKFQNHQSYRQTFLHNLNPSDSSQSIAITHHRATNKNEQIHHWQRKNKTSQSIAIPRHKVVIDSTNFAGWSGHPSIVKSADQTRISLSIDYHLVFDNYSSFPRSLSICNSFFSSILFRLAVHFFPLMTQGRWTSRQRRGCVIIISDVISDSCFRFTCSLYTCLVGEGWLRIIARPVDTYYWAWTF